MSSKGDEIELIKFESDRLWSYFEYHAKQRLEIFKFFVILSSLIISGSITLLAGVEFKELDTCSISTKNIIISTYILVATALGLLLMIFS